MNKSNLILPIFVIATLGEMHSIANPITFRDIRVHVIDTRGQPADGRKVDLIGLERWSMEPYFNNDPSKPSKFWHFVTNKAGDVVIPIGDFAGWEGNELRPGWGVYSVVVKAGSNDAGGVSSRLWFDNAPSHHYNPNSEGWAPEWGTILPIPADGLGITVTLQKGFTLQGSVVDDQHPDVPMVGVDVRTNNDLHADTHTGMGGEILIGYAKTDAHGNFTIPHQFPNKLYVNIQPTIWLKTKKDGKWMDEVDCAIDPPANGAIRILEIGATRVARFKYFGRVLDSNGKPVTNAQVEIGLTSNPDSRLETWFDDHNSVYTHTKPDGSYELTTSTPWVRWINAGISGQPRGVYRGKLADYPTLPPGNYDVSLPANLPTK